MRAGIKPAQGPAEGDVPPASPSAVASLPDRRRVPPVVYGIAVLVVLTLLFTTTQSSFNMYTFDRVLLACFGAVALNVLMGTAGQTSMGNAAFLLIGAMSTVWFARAGVPFPLDSVLAALTCGVVGALAALPAIRLRSLYLALATLALHFIAVFAATRYQTSDDQAALAGFRVRVIFASKGLLGAQHYWAWLLTVLLALLFIGATRLTSRRSGRAWRMIRDHEAVAPMFGINVIAYKLMAFVTTSMIVGFAGSLSAHFSGSVNVEGFTLLLAIQYIAMIFVGGLDSVAGAVVGATIITALPAYVPRWTGSILGRSRGASDGPLIAQIIYGILLVVFVSAASGGIAGWLRQAWRTARRTPASRAGRTTRHGAVP